MRWQWGTLEFWIKNVKNFHERMAGCNCLPRVNRNRGERFLCTLRYSNIILKGLYYSMIGCIIQWWRYFYYVLTDRNLKVLLHLLRDCGRINDQQHIKGCELTLWAGTTLVHTKQPLSNLYPVSGGQNRPPPLSPETPSSSRLINGFHPAF